MQKYLLTVLIKEDLKESERKELLDSITKKFGSLVKEDLWGLRSLAYPVKKQQKAFYAHYEFEAEPSTIPSLDKSLKLNEDILRYLLVKVRSQRTKVKNKLANKQSSLSNKKEVMEKEKVELDDSTVESQITV